MPGRPRLALVVAAHCASMRPLPALEPAARRLYGLLLDPMRGVCDAALEGRTSLVLGEPSAGEIVADVRDAIRNAGETGGTLVLALMGHGFTGAGNCLYFMGGGSHDGVARTSANVNSMLTEAADEVGIGSVAAIVDTCFAGTGAPSSQDLVTGVRQGQSNVAVLMAAAANEPAYGLRLSREVADVIETGAEHIDGTCPAFLDVEAVRELVKNKTAGQIPTAAIRLGDAFGTAPWLSLNARHSSATNDPIVSDGHASMAILSRGEILSLIQLLVAIPAVHDFSRVEKVVAQLPMPIPAHVIDSDRRGIDLAELLHTFEANTELDPWRRMIDLLRMESGGDPHPVDVLAAELRSLGLFR